MRDFSVYFIQSGPRGPIKIGSAIDVAERCKVLQVGNPVPLRILAVLSPSRAREIATAMLPAWDRHRAGAQTLEVRLQSMFYRALIRGEWFRRSRKLMRWIADNAEART